MKSFKAGLILRVASVMQSDDVFYKNVAAFQNTQDCFQIAVACQIKPCDSLQAYYMMHLFEKCKKKPIYIGIDYTSDDRFFVNNKSANSDSAWNQFKDEQGYSAIHAFVDTANRIG